MEIKAGYLYFVDDAFFEKVNDHYLKIKYGDTSRPHYAAFLDAKTSLYWLVLCSSKVDKYEMIIQTKQANHKPTDSIKVITIQDKMSVLLFQDMFPINERYINEQYIWGQYIRGGQEVYIAYPDVIYELEKTAKKLICR